MNRLIVTDDETITLLDMHSLIQPNDWIVLRLSSGTLKVLQVLPNT